QPHDHAAGGVGEIGMMTERLALVYIGQVDFDERNADTGQSIAFRHAGVCVGTGIDDDEIDTLGAGLVDPVDKPAFVITLKKLTLCATLVSQGPQTAIDILEGLMSVDIRLPGTQQVEVGPVKDQNM